MSEASEPPRRRRKARAAPAAPAASPTSNDPVELAMEAEAGDTAPDSPARRLILKQEKLIGWQIASERASYALKLLTGLVGLVAAVLVAWAVWDASRYQGLVVEAFSAPPDLAARGLTGQVIAGKLLDDLVLMQSQTESVRASGSYAIDWGDKIEVQIPQTGVSIGDLQRVLREQLGRETRISGVVYRRPDGRLAVTARTGGAAGQTFVGPEADLDGLMRQAAESVYGQTQPYRYSAYLKAQGRTEEAVKVLSSFEGRKDTEAAWALRGWAYIDMDAGRYREASAKLRRALAIEPDMAALHFSLSQTEQSLGHSEASLAAIRKARQLFKSGRSKEVSPGGIETMLSLMDVQERTFVADYTGLATLERPGAGYGVTPRSIALSQAVAWAMARDPARARALTAGMVPWGGKTPNELAEDATLFVVQGLTAVAIDDHVGAVAPLQQAMAKAAEAGGEGYARLTVGPFLAEALARAGRVPEARALAVTLPLDCDDCLVARATVEAHGGNPAEADRLFARAVRQAPSTPFAYAAWGRARLARGEAAEAVKLFRQARARAPAWADPWKYEGDALMAMGEADKATGAYAKGAQLAPRWRALHLAWAGALERAGRREEAVARRRLAQAMFPLPPLVIDAPGPSR